MDAAARREIAQEILVRALRGADPAAGGAAAISRAGDDVRFGPLAVPLAGLRRVFVLGAGKAAPRLAEGVLASLRAALPPGVRVEGVLLVPEGLLPARVAPLAVHAVRPPDRNEPTDAARARSAEALETVRSLGPGDVLLFLGTGGGSATLTAPWPGVDPAEEQDALGLLAADGAPIEALNTLRRHLSAVKGGRLAEAAEGALAVVSLLASDVDGDLPHVIASGPCVPDPTTFRDALALRADWPRTVRRHLEAGVRGEVPETPKTLPATVAWQVVASPDDVLRAALGAARGAVALPRPASGPLDDVVRAHVERLRDARGPLVVVSVGEATVSRPHDAGPGGRAGHLAVALALAAEADARLAGRATVLVGATDGEDGSSGTAGGIVDTDVLRRARAAGIDPAAALRRGAALEALRAGGGTLPRGATGANAQDVRIVVLAAPQEEG